MPRTIEVGKLVEKDGRGYGQRTMTDDMLAKIANRMSELGNTQANAAVRAWLDDSVKPPGKTALEAAAKELEAKKPSSENWKDAVYFEAAAFCCRAWL